MKGIKLALSEANGKAGSFTVNYQSLDDSTATSGRASWDPNQTQANARKVATDPKAVYYIGEFNSGAAKVSIPILNEAGVPQVSPANTYVGLTTNEPGSAPGEPQKYYPTGDRTYLRIVPRDTIQAVAGLITMKKDGCTKVAVANDKEAYGAGLATLLELQKDKYGVDIVSRTPAGPDAAELPLLRRDDQGTGRGLRLLRRYRVQRRGADHKDVNAAIPNAKIYGGDGVCTELATPRRRSMASRRASTRRSSARSRRLTCRPTRAARTSWRRTRRHTARPTRTRMRSTDTRSMKLGLDTITGLGAQGNDKAAVLKALFAIKARNSVLGTYGFDSQRRHDAEVVRPVQGRQDRRPAVSSVPSRRTSSTRMRSVRDPAPLAVGGSAPSLATFPRLWKPTIARAEAVTAASAPSRCAAACGGPALAGALGPDHRARWRCPVDLRHSRPRVRLSRVRGRARDASVTTSRISATTSSRALQRDDLGADRDRLHARLRDHRADQLRPRRRVHDRLVRPAPGSGHRSGSG